MQKVFDSIEKKIKVTSLEIIVTGTKDKPYFEIKYKEVGKEDYHIGYSSYDLNKVLDWKERDFEIVNQVAKEYEHDFCEWKKYEDKRIRYKNCRWRDEDIDQLTVRHFYYCPYCGKKIKVVEPEMAESEE